MEYIKHIRGLVNEYDPLAIKIKQARKLAKKWQRYGLLQGLNDQNLRNTTAILLQNQARQLLRQTSTTGLQYHQEWSGVALPLVRRFIAKLAAKDFVTIQPMTAPSGLVFYLDFKFGSNQQNGTFITQNSSIYGTTFSGTAGSTDYMMNTNTQSGMYGAGKFGYTINDVSASVVSGSITTASATIADFNYDGYYSASYANYKTATIALTAIDGADLNGYRAFGISSSTAGFISNFLPKFTKLSGDNIVFVFTGSAAKGDSVIYYHKQPKAYERGDFQYKGTSDLEIPEINIELTNKMIVAKTRKLKAIWTQQLIEDLNAYHAIDGQAQLTGVLSDQITVQVDLELIDMLVRGGYASQTFEYWSADPGYDWNGAGFTQNSRYFIQNKSDWYKTLGIKMQKLSNVIHQKTLRGGANFAIVSPLMATVLETIPGFMTNTDGLQTEFNAGFTKVGTFANRFSIYKNPYMVQDNMMIMGYKGNSFLEFGAAYCPYIPLIMTPLVFDPTNFVPRRGIYTRYGKTLMRSDFYGLLFVDGLQTV